MPLPQTVVLWEPRPIMLPVTMNLSREDCAGTKTASAPLSLRISQGVNPSPKLNGVGVRHQNAGTRACSRLATPSAVGLVTVRLHECGEFGSYPRVQTAPAPVPPAVALNRRIRVSINPPEGLTVIAPGISTE